MQLCPIISGQSSETGVRQRSEESLERRSWMQRIHNSTLRMQINAMEHNNQIDLYWRIHMVWIQGVRRTGGIRAEQIWRSGRSTDLEEEGGVQVQKEEVDHKGRMKSEQRETKGKMDKISVNSHSVLKFWPNSNTSDNPYFLFQSHSYSLPPLQSSYPLFCFRSPLIYYSLWPFMF